MNRGHRPKPGILLSLSLVLSLFLLPGGCTITHVRDEPSAASEPGGPSERDESAAVSAPPTSDPRPGEAEPASDDGSPPFCGGIAAIACPGRGRCVDDPRDDCDPRRGGADCGGICECTDEGVCPIGEVFDPSPAVCDCVSSGPGRDGPCATVRCARGMRCVAEGGHARCESFER